MGSAMKNILILIFLLFPLCANATTYWVSNTGTETTAGNCSGESPMDGSSACDLATVNAAASAGDTIYLRGGESEYEVYSITATSGTGEGIYPDNSGTSYEAMITYSTYNNEMVHLQGNADVSSTLTYGININQKNYIKVTGSAENYLKVSRCFRNVNVSGNGVTSGAVYARYNEIAYVFSTEVGLSGFTTGSAAGNIVYNNAEYNWVHHCKFSKQGTSLAGNLFQIASDPEPSWNADEDVTRFNVIENNEMLQAGHAVLSINGHYDVIRNNYVHNEEWMDAGAYNYAFRNVLAYGEYDYTAKGVIFEGNRIGRSGRSLSYATSSNSIDWAQSEAILRYNAVFDAGSKALEMRAAQYAGTQYYMRANKNRIYNNTFFYNDSNEDTASNSMVIDFQYSTGTDYYTSTPIYWQCVQENVLKNNLFYDNYSNRNNYDAYGYGSGNESSFSACPVSASQGCNVVDGSNYNDGVGENTDPGFVDETLTSYDSWTLPNLNLQSDSPVINQGTYLTQAVGNGTDSTSLTVDDARYFQDGAFGSASGCDPTKWASGINIAADWICIGTVGNCVQIDSINYSTNAITLASAKTWSDDDNIWLYKKSDGETVLAGSAPDIGAYEFTQYPSVSGVDSIGVTIGQ
jgi:hypothetical protein